MSTRFKRRMKADGQETVVEVRAPSTVSVRVEPCGRVIVSVNPLHVDTSADPNTIKRIRPHNASAVAD